MTATASAMRDGVTAARDVAASARQRTVAARQASMVNTMTTKRACAHIPWIGLACRKPPENTAYLRSSKARLIATTTPTAAMRGAMTRRLGNRRSGLDTFISD